MATVTDNVFTEGLSGKLGASLLFRTLRGKTFVTTPARKPDRRRETAAQKNTRTTFKQAAEWASAILQNPERKNYYQQRARKLKLPNAYTAALTDYMRKPKLSISVNKDESVYGKVSKDGFALANVEVLVHTPEGDRVLPANSAGYYWSFTLKKEEAPLARIRITDVAGREVVMPLSSS